MKLYHYIDRSTGVVIRIPSNRRPSINTKPKSGAWILKEFIRGKWEIPAFPEILLSTIEKFEYLGAIEHEKETQ